MTPEDKLRYKNLEEEIMHLRRQKLIIRARCEHEEVNTKEYNNLNYKDPLQESAYWTEFTCADCGLTWNSDIRKVK